MTKEKMIEVLIRAIECTADAESIMDEIRKRDGKLNGLETIAEYNIASVIYALEQEMLAADAKKSGKTKLLSACKSILKSASEVQPFFKNAFYIKAEEKQYQCFCDGYRLIALSNPLNVKTSSLEETIANNHNGIAKNICETGYNYFSKLPDANELNAEIKRIKTLVGKNKPVLIRIDDIINVNASFLLDAMNAIDTETILYQGTKNGKINKTLMLKDSENIAIICPVIPNENYKITIECKDGKIVR